MDFLLPRRAARIGPCLTMLTGVRGIALVAMDGRRNGCVCLDVLLKRLTAIGSVFALAGVIEFFFGYNIVNKSECPGSC